MSGKKSVPFRNCRSCGKRGFVTERDADKALGRAKASRANVRGVKMENRYYECEEGLFHLTAQSRKVYESYTT